MRIYSDALPLKCYHSAVKITNKMHNTDYTDLSIIDPISIQFNLLHHLTTALKPERQLDVHESVHGDTTVKITNKMHYRD
jgi:hypothetical protein